MGPLQKGYEKRFAVKGGELKHINRKGCFKHSESAGKRGKNNTNIKYKSNVGWIFTVLVVVKVIVRVFLGSFLNPRDLVATASWKGLCARGRSRRFPISLDLQMLECELFRTSEMILTILKGFLISFECPNSASSVIKKCGYFSRDNSTGISALLLWSNPCVG